MPKLEGVLAAIAVVVGTGCRAPREMLPDRPEARRIVRSAFLCQLGGQPVWEVQDMWYPGALGVIPFRVIARWPPRSYSATVFAGEVQAGPSDHPWDPWAVQWAWPIPAPRG